MAFIRIKKIKGNEYAYLVESRWNPEKKASRQRTIKYLGPATEVVLEDVPSQYRDEKVDAFLLRNSVLAAHRRAKLISSLKRKLLASLLEGDVARTRSVSQRGFQALGVDRFYVQVITATMHAVGELWERREIYVSHEHLATNTMTQVVVELNANITWTGVRLGDALVCTPDGERHMFVAQVLKGLLTNRGYRVLDISDSAPTASIAAFAALKQPRLLLISVTMREHLLSARRLIEAIRVEAPGIRILVGGRAWEDGGVTEIPEGVSVAGMDTVQFLDEMVTLGPT